MDVKAIIPACVAVLFCLYSQPAFSQQYHSNDITPPSTPGGKLSGSAAGKQVGSGSNNHAYLLSGNALTAVDLTPSGYYSSQANSISSDGSQECGFGSGPSGGIHPLVWFGSSSSYADLIPSGFSFGYCTSVDSGEQVGFSENQSYFITASHAYLWRGSSTTAVDLHPSALYPFSRAMGNRNGEQVEYVSTFAYPYGEFPGYHTTSHAYRWSGSAASGVDLNPAGFDASEALATNGLHQGGWGYIAADLNSPQHALLWFGDAASAVDLHPAGYSASRVNALNADIQVGDGWIGTPYAVGSVRHALAWSGTADTVIDLNQYLPAGYTNGVATGIDADGNIVGYAYNMVGYNGIYTPPDAIAVVFAPGQAPASQLAGISVDLANVAPGAIVTGTVSLGGAAPTGGVVINFLSTNVSLAGTPGNVVIAEGSSSATFPLPILGNTLTMPTSFRVYASDGSVSRFTSLTVTPVVQLSNVMVNPVEGGFSSAGSVSLTVPAQSGGATVALSSGDPNLLSVPASVFLPQFYSAISFSATTTPVQAITTVPVTATFNGQSVTSNVTLNPAPVLSLAAVSVPSLVGGQSVTGTVALNTFPRDAAGATISLVSSDPALLQVPATVQIPQGVSAASFVVTSNSVSSIKTVTITASFNGSAVNGTLTVNPTPTVTISTADFVVSTMMLKVQADTSYANSILTYGIDGGGPIGTMQLELGVWKGSIVLPAAPKTVTVWNSNGGQAVMNVTVRTTTGGGGGGGSIGGGGGGSTSTPYKLSISKTGKGTVTASPSAASYAPGTSVTLTATPDPGSPWIGWSGACSGNATTCTVIMNSNLSVTANFK